MVKQGLEDIVITVAFEMKQAQIAKIKKQAQDVANAIGRSVRKAMTPGSSASSGTLLDQIIPKDQAKSFSQAIMPAVNGALKQMDVELRGVNKQMVHAAKTIRPINSLIDDLNKDIQKGKSFFAGWALSIMFFGMALKSAFDSIWRSSTKTFNDVIHSVEGAYTGFDVLSGALTYLGFSAGQALEPIAFMLVPWIDKVSDLIQNNEKLFRGIVIGLGVGGTALTALGMGKLAFDGIAEAVGVAKDSYHGLMGAIEDPAQWEKLKGNIKNAVGVVAIGYALVEAVDAYKEFEDGQIYKGMIGALSSAALAYGGIRILKGQKGGASLITIGVALDLVEEGVFFSTIARVLGVFTALVGATIDRIKWMFRNGIKNGILEGILEGIDVLVGPIGQLLFGDQIKSLKKEIGGLLGFQDISDFNFKQSFEKNYQDMVRIGKGWDDYFNSIIELDTTATPTGSSNIQQYGNNYYFNDVKVERQDGETNADVINRILEQINTG